MELLVAWAITLKGAKDAIVRVGRRWKAPILISKNEDFKKIYVTFEP